MTLGSSPLTRGAPLRQVEDGRVGGLIPADAGSTDEWHYPCLGACGSSPLTRGAPYA